MVTVAYIHELKSWAQVKMETSCTQRKGRYETPNPLQPGPVTV
jgi:hypothetical protein